MVVLNEKNEVIMMYSELFYHACFLCFTIGMACGAFLASHKWSSNANHPFRIEYRGKFYKVKRED